MSDSAQGGPSWLPRPEAMARELQSLCRRWRQDYGFRTATGATLSLALTALFALYNGWLGMRNRSLWNGSICVYYLALTALRGSLIITEARRARLTPSMRRQWGRRAYRFSSIALLALNMTLVVPISLMARLLRPVGMGLIPAIAMATYATWKITMAIINYRRRRQSRDLLIRQLRTITLIDALVSVLTLQNTLVMVNTQGDLSGMLTLVSISSAAIFLAIIGISAWNFMTGPKRNNRSPGHSPLTTDKEH